MIESHEIFRPIIDRGVRVSNSPLKVATRFFPRRGWDAAKSPLSAHFIFITPANMSTLVCLCEAHYTLVDWQVSAGQCCNCVFLSFCVVIIVKSLHVVSHYGIFEASQSRHRLCAETERPQICCNTIFAIYWNMQTRNISILTPDNHIAVDVWVQRGNSALRQIRCTILTLDNHIPDIPNND